jgi:LCP family protein required for cell wall assembly
MMLFFACSGSLFLIEVIAPPIDVLIVGLDARRNEGTMTRTDSIMLLGVDTDELRVSLLSIPRDLFVNVPGYGMQRINTVNFLAEVNQRGTGPQLLSETIAANFGIQPDRYVRVNFEGFRALVDAVGGLDIYVENAIFDPAYPTDDYGTRTLRIDSGWQHMDGETALAFARTRHADDDYQRAERQQKVVRALARKLLIPVYWPPALFALSQHVETSLNPLDMVRTLPPLLVRFGEIDRLVIDRDYIQGTQSGYAVPDYDKLSSWIAPRFD